MGTPAFLTIYADTGVKLDLRINATSWFSDLDRDVGEMIFDQFTIGARRQTAATGFAFMNVAEFIVYNRKLTTAEQDALSDYAIDRYDIEVDFDGG